MPSFSSAGYVSLISMALSFQTAYGFVGTKDSRFLPSGTQLEKKVIRIQNTVEQKASFKDLPGDNMHMQKDPKTGVIRVLWGEFYHPQFAYMKKKNLVQFSKSFISQNLSLFGISEGDARIDEKALYIGEDEQFVMFRIYRDGIQIKDAGIDLRFKKGKLVQVINQSFAEAKVIPTENEADNLEDQARQLVPDTEQIQRGSDLLRVVETEQGYQLQKVSSFHIQSAKGSFSAQLDPSSGKTYELADNAMYLRGQVKADSYERWYKDSLAPISLDLIGLKTNSGKIVSGIEGLFDAEENAEPSLNGLEGKYVKIHDMGEKPISKTATKNADGWSIYVEKKGQSPAHSDEGIAQSMIYQQTHKMINYAKKYIDSPWFNTPLLANANLRSTCNAHWDGSTINFYTGGDGCANTGLISDVVFHEWGHGLDANTGGIDDSAYSEGFGDIVSMLMTRSNILGIGFMLADQSPVRDLEPRKIYPRDKGEVHSEGLIIGSTFWELYKTLKAIHGDDEAINLVSKYALRSIFTARTYLDVYNAILVIDDDDNNLNNGTPNGCTINAVFMAHGLAQENMSCKFAQLESFDIEDSDKDGIVEPGETVSFHVKAKNNTQAELSSLTGQFSINTPGIQVDQGDLSWSPIAAGATASSETAGLFKIDSSVACGTNFTSTLKMKRGRDELISTKDWTVGRNVGTESLYAASGLPLVIKDVHTTKATVAISSNWGEHDKVQKVHLKFDVKHSYLGDLTINLIAPNGQAHEVYRGRGKGTGSVHYDQDLTQIFAGAIGKGEWTLSVRDGAARDEGMLEKFELLATPAQFTCD
ncbi:MAG: proprotein convertase P-domain-containing protein [Oligoflexales bacterium]|nr:proprotein convertase P-domain-containing protein [Oligoflexales bacterium]